MQLISKLNELLNEVFVEENFDYKLDIVLLLFYEIYLKYMQEARIPLLLKRSPHFMVAQILCL